MEEIRAVTLPDVLKARDDRALRQARLLQQYHQPLISFTMNIAGSIKVDGEIRRAFDEGKGWIEAHLTRQAIPVLAHEAHTAWTGCEAVWAVEADAAWLKAQMTAIEESCPLGRLFDIDVIDGQGQHLSRSGERACLICGGPVRACARSRRHPAEALFAKAKEIIRAHFQTGFARRIAQQAQRALLYEAITTPKPGLVDCHHSGAHRDMDLFSFADSISVLGSYFKDCVQLGLHQQPLEQLQHAGILAERAMLDAAGANTHKGAIFSLGILCCAVGRCGENASLDAVCSQAAEIGQFFFVQMTSAQKQTTSGERQYHQYGLTGARGEAASGFGSVKEIGLPVLEAELAKGASRADAGKAVLLHLMAKVMDSNVIHRAGMEGQTWVMEQASRLLQEGWSDEKLLMLDAEMIRRNISPGGSADLLAVTWFLHLISRMNDDQDGGESCHE